MGAILPKRLAQDLINVSLILQIPPYTRDGFCRRDGSREVLRLLVERSSLKARGLRRSCRGRLQGVVDGAYNRRKTRANAGFPMFSCACSTTPH